MRNCEEKEERLMLLESWRDFEREFGSDSTMERVHKLLPEKVKKRRKLTAEDGVRTLFIVKFRENQRQVGSVLFLISFTGSFSRTLVGRSTTTTSSLKTPRISPTSNCWPWPRCGRGSR